MLHLLQIAVTALDTLCTQVDYRCYKTHSSTYWYTYVMSCYYACRSLSNLVVNCQLDCLVRRGLQQVMYVILNLHSMLPWLQVDDQVVLYLFERSPRSVPERAHAHTRHSQSDGRANERA
jgi:hypothetical protein